MIVKTGIIFITLALGCLAIPTPKSEELSQFFDHEDFEDSPEGRIVGGSVAASGSHPWLVALTTGTMVRTLTCGGSIISQRTVLTAAHCIDHLFQVGSLTGSLRVTAGTNRWNGGGQTYFLTGNATHPNYVSHINKNDIAMLFTFIDIVFSERVKPIALSFEYVGAGVMTRVAGWGRTSAGSAVSFQLLEIDLLTIDGQRCERDVANANAMWPNMRAPHVEPHIELCTFHSRGRGTCRGDSGGALVRVDSGTQVGIVSWGFPCALGAPDMFVRLSAFQSWIQKTMR